MRLAVLALAAIIALTGQTPSPAPVAGTVLHLVYHWGYNTNADHWGKGTGTTTVDLVPAPDGGVVLYGTDWIWNTVRARQANVCEAYASGKIDCTKHAPMAISPFQVTLFPILAAGYFKKIKLSKNATWNGTYTIRAALLPGYSASHAASQPFTWTFEYAFTDKGQISPQHSTVLITSNGRFTREGGFYKGSGQQKIAYAPEHGVPIAVSDVRTHLPQKSINSNDLVEMKLLEEQP